MRSLPSNRFIGIILCLALLVRVMVPMGFMPDMSSMQHGLYKIRICTGYGPHNILVDQKQTGGGTHDPAHKTETSSSLCSFAGMQGSALPVLGMVFGLLLFWRQLRFVRSRYSIPSLSLTTAWPRGPPALI